MSSSLLPPNAASGERFNKTGHCTVVETRTVETFGLDEAIDRFAIPPPHYIKLDVEGLELDILRSGERSLAEALVIKTEVSFLPFREGQPMAREVDAYLAARDFELMALVEPAHWRRHGHVTHPLVARESVPYSRGQLAHGDLLYMRRPGASSADSPDRALRAAWLAMAFGYFDRAEEYLSDPAPAGALAERWKIDPATAVRRASLVCGRAAWRAALYGQVRGIVPFLRHATAALLQH